MMNVYNVISAILDKPGAGEEIVVVQVDDDGQQTQIADIRYEEDKVVIVLEGAE